MSLGGEADLIGEHVNLILEGCMSRECLIEQVESGG